MIEISRAIKRYKEIKRADAEGTALWGMTAPGSWRCQPGWSRSRQGHYLWSSAFPPREKERENLTHRRDFISLRDWLFPWLNSPVKSPLVRADILRRSISPGRSRRQTSGPLNTCVRADGLRFTCNLDVKLEKRLSGNKRLWFRSFKCAASSALYVQHVPEAAFQNIESMNFTDEYPKNISILIILLY